MATSKTTLNNPLFTTKFEDTDVSPGSSASKVAISGSAVNLGKVFIDNTAFATKMYLKLYNVASDSLTVGTTTPLLVLPVEASTTVQYTFVPNIQFSSACSYSLCTTGGTAGTTGANTAGIKAEFLIGS
tara:strand:- start:822 stop:1208 length:387 start_codon:yes stop_codon:yes gene_type:complete